VFFGPIVDDHGSPVTYVRSEAEVARLVNEVGNVFGDINVLVVNATGPQPFLSIEEQTWDACSSRGDFTKNSN